jgi:lysine 2,3-aminomutase
METAETAISTRNRFRSMEIKTENHRKLRHDRWWQTIPAWSDVTKEEFADHRWQLKNSLTKPEHLLQLVGELVSPSFVEDLEAGLARAPMAVRLTPYLVSLVDWSAPTEDPLRRQFLPLGSEHEPDHPMCTFDALEEQRDAVAPGLTHRYPDKVLFLALDVCPVYCRYCTRSYSVGSDTEEVDKLDFHPSVKRWEEVFAYLRATPKIEDVVVSGGDLSLLSARLLEHIGDQLLQIPHVRRIRLATKGLALLPQKALSDEPWVEAITTMAERGRQRGVQVCVHTHFAHPEEITEMSRQACDVFFQRGIPVRNQCVLLRGVNDDPATMICLVRKLSWINVQPYYVYIHDMVPGVETLRTSLTQAVEVEKLVRGQTAGFMTPTFVCDTYGGGGKRDLHSFEVYDSVHGVAVYHSPVVDRKRPFFHFDPLRVLSSEVCDDWRSDARRARILERVVRQAGFSGAVAPKA